MYKSMYLLWEWELSSFKPVISVYPKLPNLRMTYKHQSGLHGTQSKESGKTGCGKGAIPAQDALARDSLAQYGDYLAP